MNTQQIVTKAELHEAIENYKAYSKEVHNYYETMSKLKPAAATAKYGIEASMPRGGSSGHSDPTFQQAMGIKLDAYTKRREQAVKMIDQRRKNVKGVRENDILDMWIEGFSIIDTAERLQDISKSTVSRIRDKILDAMAKGE